MKDARLSEKVSAKFAKEMFDHGGKLECEFKHLISGKYMKNLNSSG